MRLNSQVNLDVKNVIILKFYSLASQYNNDNDDESNKILMPKEKLSSVSAYFNYIKWDWIHK